MAQNKDLKNIIKEILAQLKQRLEEKRFYDQTTFSKHEDQFKNTLEVIENLNDAIEPLEAGENISAMTFMKQEQPNHGIDAIFAGTDIIINLWLSCSVADISVLRL
eukprot:TCONS_00013682-protein